MRRLALLASAVVTLLAAAPAAHAATATTADGFLRYTALAGEVNDLTVRRVSGDQFRLTDLGAVIAAGTGCTQESPNVVVCTTAPRKAVIVHLGDQDDRALSRTGRRVQLWGEDGNDRLAGGSGRDLLDGGPGNDTLTGGRARDALRGRDGDDALDGGSGDDRLFGHAGNDVLTGGSGDDRLGGGSGNDALSGESGRDRLSGYSGDDTLAGGSDVDFESGGPGDDTLNQEAATNGADTLAGDDGNDTVDYSARSGPVTVSLDDVAGDGEARTNERDNVRSSVDRVLGGQGNDWLIGRDGASDTFLGGPGDDVIRPRRGPDHVDGGPGIDQISLRDLDSDDVICGDDEDSVAGDMRDIIGADCEHARRTASMSIALAARAAYPTVTVRVVCPESAFKACQGRALIRSLKRVRTRDGRLRNLTFGVRGFELAPGSAREIGVRIRSGTRRYIGRSGVVVRAALSAFDGAGPARRDATRFRLLPR